MIDWRVVQPNALSPFDFSPYDSLRKLAIVNGLKVLPHFINCLPELSAPESLEAVRYPSPESYGSFVAFVATGMKYFDEVADTAEIWNEPNLREFGSLPPQVFAALVRASSDGLGYFGRSGAFQFGPKRVVSGGLSPKGETAGDWQAYRRDFLEVVGDKDFDFGLHSYDFRNFDGWESNALAEDIAAATLANVDAAAEGLKPGRRYG